VIRPFIVGVCATPLLRGLDSSANHYQPVLSTRHRTSNQQQMLIRQHFDNLQVLHGHAAVAHAAGHTRTFPNMTRIGACTDRARRAMAIALAVGLRATAETVAPDHTLKATPLGGASHINDLARLKDIGAKHLANLVIFNIVGIELTQVPY
jgi:cytochrome bd-type quinol oxidase subunit 2